MKARLIVASVAGLLFMACIARADRITLAENLNNSAQELVEQHWISVPHGLFTLPRTADSARPSLRLLSDGPCDTVPPKSGCADLDMDEHPGHYAHNHIKTKSGDADLAFEHSSNNPSTSSASTTGLGTSFGSSMLGTSNSSSDSQGSSASVDAPPIFEPVFLTSTDSSSTANDGNPPPNDQPTTPAPEPSSSALLAIGVLPLVWPVRKRELV